MSKLMCYSRNGFINTLSSMGWSDDNLPDDWVFVSIGDNWEKEPHPLTECDRVINLDFDDIGGYRVWDSIPNYKWTEEEKDRYKNVYGMSDGDADRLFKFLDKNIGKNIMVHCSAGISRSQGVVRFLLDCYPDTYKDEDTNPNNKCIVPNLHVVCLLKRQFYNKYIF